MPDTPDQHLDQVKGKVGMGEQELAEMRSTHHRARGRLDGHDRRGARRAVKRHLAHVLARTVEIDDDFLAGRVACVHLDFAREHDEQRIGMLAFVDQDGMLRELANDAGCGYGAQRLLRQRRKRIGRRSFMRGGHGTVLREY